ncbi:MAG: F0F1 ATP synthase subunit epsilon [Chloroflexota bacterium]|nr:F0F1 ATP synthase subunit epsilon [Chloroflexota bacterium]MDP9320119.1 F0F1 ATP synthase subunit epsilon [Chloroflexota bacterium]
MPIRLEIVTPERAVLTDDVDMVIAPGSEGYLGILPHHTPLLTTLGPGELRIKKGGAETSLVVFGGFMDVRPDRVVVLTEAAERVEDIDESRAEAARARAREALQAGPVGLDEARARASLERAMVRLRVSERRRRRGI